MLFESVVLAGLANMTLKSVIGRSRPQTEEGPFRFRGFQTALERTSLPSGHSTVAFAVSSVLARRIDNPYATVGLYGMAALTAVSRIYHDNHWLSDTFLGAAIGTSVGLAVAGGGEETSVSIEPSGSGLRLSYRF
jgi:membrane-associated phospholipid phosphatase